MADNFGIYDLSARLEHTISSSLESALEPVSGNINIRRIDERHLRDTGEIDLQNNSFNKIKNSFVISELSSSNHEEVSKNTFFSGSEFLEGTANEITNTVDLNPYGKESKLFYSKKSRFQKILYSVTASDSFDFFHYDPISFSAGLYDPLPLRFPTNYEIGAVRTSFDPVSGTIINAAHMFAPAVVNFDIKEYGKIRDIKVWVEFIHDIRGGTGVSDPAGIFNDGLGGGSSGVDFVDHGLKSVQLALRSPNVNFDNSHPLWNDKSIVNKDKWLESQAPNWEDGFSAIPPLLKNTYLLWAGHACEHDLSYVIGNQTGSSPEHSPTSTFQVRKITSSSYGPGIGLAISSDTSPDYQLGTYVPAFRTISTTPVGGKFMGVLFPTGEDLTPPNIYNGYGTLNQIYAFFTDDGTIINPDVQMFFSASEGATNNTIGSSRLRKSRTGANALHGTCIFPGTGVVYGIKSLGDTTVTPWVHRWPVLNGDTSTQHIPFAADSFYDFALDSQDAAHFLWTQWRGDLGLQIVYYGHLSGPVTKLGYVPPGCKPTNTLPVGAGFFTNFQAIPVTTTAPIVTPSAPITIPVDHSRNYVEGQGVRLIGTGGTEYTRVTSIPNTTSIELDKITLAHAAGAIIDAWNFPDGVVQTDLWTQSGSNFIFGELDNPVLNGGQGEVAAGSVGGYLQIEIDKKDMIHVVYADSTNLSVKYGKKQVSYDTFSGSWSFELVNKHPAPSTWPTHISLDIDSKNEPHVAYSLFDGVTDNLYHAHSGTDSGWSTTLVRQLTGVHHGTRIKIDNLDRPTIVTSVQQYAANDNNHAVILFTSSSYAGWTNKNIYSPPRNTTLPDNDDPVELSLNFNVDNSIRIYSGGGYLSGMWETRFPQQAKYSEYDSDIDMRTIFSDSSKNLNPRNLSNLYASAKAEDPGSSSLYGTRILNSRDYPSPFSASLGLLAFAWPTPFGSDTHIFEPYLEQTDHLTGANCPWMFDSRVPPGIFHGLDYAPIISATFGGGQMPPLAFIPGINAGRPPNGWLTGPATDFTIGSPPGNIAAENEFPTKGPNIGPEDIQPVYPLLDDIFVEKITDQTALTTNVEGLLPINRKKIIGFRPGLRGTEVHGNWKFYIGLNWEDFPGAPIPYQVLPQYYSGIWFRQVRLEFLIDTGEDVSDFYPSKSRRFNKTGNVSQAGRKLIAIMSGSSAWDSGINYVFSVVPADHGRSVGITSLTGSNQFSVFSQLTGALPAILSGAGRYDEVIASYLSNEFGTPYIPVSSGSAEIPSFDTFSIEEAKESRRVFDETLNPKTSIPKDNTLRAALARADVVRSTRDSIVGNTVRISLEESLVRKTLKDSLNAPDTQSVTIEIPNPRVRGR